MDLCRLIYFSYATKDAGLEGVESILATAAARNRENDITGLLTFGRSRFLQVLEGGREVVTRTFGRIASDPRHERVTLISFESTGERRFADWSMGYVGNIERHRHLMRRFGPLPKFEPEKLHVSSALALLAELGECHDMIRGTAAGENENAA